MKKSHGILSLRRISVLGILGAFAFSAAAYADCGNFDQLVSQSNALQAPFGDLSNPNCNNKPDESVVTGLISCFQGLSGEPALTQSQADLQISTLYGVITQCYSSGTGQLSPGDQSFKASVAATQADPTYEDAWISFADTVAALQQQGWLEREVVEHSWGISISSELQTAINGLSALPQDAAVSAELAKLKSL